MNACLKTRWQSYPWSNLVDDATIATMNPLQCEHAVNIVMACIGEVHSRLIGPGRETERGALTQPLMHTRTLIHQRTLVLKAEQAQRKAEKAQRTRNHLKGIAA